MIALLLAFSVHAADFTLMHKGVATNDGKVVYIEQHEALFRDGEAVTAKTTYVGADGKTEATLTSDFKNSITNADHEFHDLRDNRRYGVRWKDGKAVMWDQEVGKKERTEKIDKDFADGKLVIGGQGLHYHMRTRLAEFAKKDTAIAILIPGKLDWYSFLVTPAGEDKGLKKFVIKAQSAFLRLFAPKLEVWYAEDGKLMRYRGLSNLPDAKGGNQQVEIKYEY